MSKTFTLLLLSCVLQLTIYSQLTLQYKECSGGNCPNGTTPQNWQTNHVYSDFGMRRTNSIWHKGVDFNITGTGNPSTDEGYHLLTPVGGTITQIDGSGYKFIVVQDNSGNNYHLGYGHIFNDDVFLNNTISVGELILYRWYNNGYKYAIINTNNNVAISNENGYIFTYGGQSYTTSNQVAAQQVIAPLGGSGGFHSHLHLYRVINPNINPNLNIDNCLDPLQILNHIQTDFNISIDETENLTQTGNTTFYSGDNKSIVKVKCEFNSPGQHGGVDGRYYDNAIMDIDDIDLLIKKNTEDNSNYHFLQGKYNYSKISHGARWNVNYYPTSPTDIRQQYGVYNSSNVNLCIDGIIPNAYYDNPWDEIVFTDFYTRIHKDDAYGGSITLAQNPDDARYPDNKYNLAAKITTVTGNQQNNFNSPTEITIDNFKPYIKKVEINAGIASFIPFYTAEWNGVGSNIVCDYSGVGYTLPGQDITINVTASEPLTSINLNIEPSSLSANPISQSNDNMEFVFQILASQTGGWDPASTELVELHFTGTDLAGNQLEAIEHSVGPVTNQSYSIPIRQGNTTWLPQAEPGTDTFHRFFIGCEVGNYKSTKDNESIGCLRADFEAVPNIIDEDYSIQFENLSVGNPENYSWEFEMGTPSTSTNYEPIVTYNTSGVYDVSLIVSDANGSHSETKYDYIHVGSTNGEPTANFNASSTIIEVGESIDFVDASLNNPDEWYWIFDGGTPSISTEQNPTDIFYDTDGAYTVILTASNSNGNDTETKTNYIVVNINGNNNPSNANIECDFPDEVIELNSTTGDAYLIGEIVISDGSGLYKCIINFGNNDIQNSMEFSPSTVPVYKTYDTEGTYTISVSLYGMDDWGQYNVLVRTCSHDFEVIDPCGGIVDPIILFDDQKNYVIDEDVDFTAGVASPKPGEIFAYTWYKNGSINGYGVNYTTSFSTAGNHQVKVLAQSYSCGEREGEWAVNIPIFPEKCISLQWTNFPDKITVDGTYNFGGEAFWNPEEPCEPYALNTRITYDNEALINFAAKRFEYDFGINSYLNNIYVDFSFDFPDTWSRDPVRIVIEAWNETMCECGQQGWVGITTSLYKDRYTNLQTVVPYNNINWLQHSGVYNDSYYTRMERLIELGDCNSGTANKYDCNKVNNEYNAQKVWISGGNCSSAYVNSGESAEVYAHKEITFRTGFTAYYGCDFTAAIDNCGYRLISESYKIYGNEGEYIDENSVEEEVDEDRNLKDIDIFIQPNPASYETVLKYYIPIADMTYISIHSSLGEKVETIMQEYVIEGENSYIYNCEHIESGIYFIKIKSGNKTKTIKFIKI